jgi:hypothetical protein
MLNNGYLSFNELPATIRESFEKQVSETSKKEEFHRNRSGLFTASEIHKLITHKCEIAKNETSRNYIFEKAFEKVTGQTARLEIGAKSIEWGLAYEKQAVEAYETLTGNQVRFTGDEQTFLKHKTLHIGAYPDGIVLKNIPLECKCPANGGEHFKNLNCGQDVDKFSKLRFAYYIQVQTQIMLSESEFGEFFTFRPNLEEKYSRYYLRVPRSETVINQIEEAVKLASEQLNEIINSL